jgi:hypothetical protein
VLKIRATRCNLFAAEFYYFVYLSSFTLALDLFFFLPFITEFFFLPCITEIFLHIPAQINWRIHIVGLVTIICFLPSRPIIKVHISVNLLLPVGVENNEIKFNFLN